MHTSSSLQLFDATRLYFLEVASLTITQESFCENANLLRPCKLLYFETRR